MKKGFTLIELLVVVLIIGILAAIALPQYNKSVEKSRAAEALLNVKALRNAAEVFLLETGSWPTNLDELSIEIISETRDFVYSVGINGILAVKKGAANPSRFEFVRSTYNSGSGLANKFTCVSFLGKYDDICKTLGGQFHDQGTDSSGMPFKRYIL
ncbi:Type II secretion system subunit H, I [Elusimicrobium minutum Pei191]|uniref:Type II secretion system subunit H, I n=1 Tax=Elusimicrobium minutum (strain Pei191) TaxID=445932 RepID=B2KEP4_ELUMP|nr:Type II secretion system subunit H, I [Elusimicrobium minutum Pei191]